MEAPGPSTVETLVCDLRALGVEDGSIVLAHTSVSALGHVVGGPHAVALALLHAVGPSGTLVVPTHSGNLSEPSSWQHPPAPADQWPTIRAQMPAYDPCLTPTNGMGAVPDVIRSHPSARRSGHPAVSFTAVGPLSEVVTSDHRLPFGFDDHSPLARLAEVGGQVLLLGVDHDRNTSLHLAEWRAHPPAVEILQGAPMLVDGERRWVTYPTCDYDTDDFLACGEAFAASGNVATGLVGAGRALRMGVADLVAFATPWFAANRRGWGAGEVRRHLGRGGRPASSTTPR